MQKVIVIGGGMDSLQVVTHFQRQNYVQVVGIIASKEEELTFLEAEKLGIPIYNRLSRSLLEEEILILNTTDKDVTAFLDEQTTHVPHVISNSITKVLIESIAENVASSKSRAQKITKAFRRFDKTEELHSFDSIYGASDAIKLTIAQARIAANNTFPVLLRGEIGTGKALFAQAIHQESSRRNEQFIRVNCASDHSMNIEQALFGTTEDERCLFCELDGGTIYLGEVTALSLRAQRKLYDYIMTGSIQDDKADEGTQIDVKVIVGTSEPIEQALSDGLFSAELYNALLQIAIHILPIRQRTDDIVPIALRVLEQLNEQLGMNVQQLEPSAEEWLIQNEWRGNVYEIKNVLSQAMIYMNRRDDTMRIEDLVQLPLTATEKQSLYDEESTLTSLMDDYERSVLMESLHHNEGDKASLAKKLGISLRSLYYKLEKYNLLDR